MKLLLLGAASPVLTEKPDVPDGIDEAVFTEFVEGCYHDRATVSSEFTDVMSHSEPSQELKDWCRNMSMESSPQAMADTLETVRDADFRSDIEDISVPTLVCHGIHDQICLFEVTAEKLHDGIANAELVRFERSGHAIFYEEKEKLDQELIEFSN